MNFLFALTSVLLSLDLLLRLSTQTAFFGRKFFNRFLIELVNSAQTMNLKAQNGLLYTCRLDGFINCYNLTTNELLRTFGGNKGCWSFVLEDRFLYLAGLDKVIKKWNLATGKLEMSFKGSLETAC
jgi:WD40 repeat protein